MANIDDVRVVAIQLMSALRHMKAAGCLHRDIKCNNIVLSANFRCIKLCDFSSAKILDSNDGRDSLGSLRTYTLIGTPEFMAPEMLLRCGYSFEVDVWAMGVVLFELCTGTRPFTDQARDWVELNGSTAVRSTFSDSTSASALQLGEPAHDDISKEKIANFFHTHCGIDYFALDVFCTTTLGRQLADFISTHLITSDRSFRDINIICQKVYISYSLILIQKFMLYICALQAPQIQFLAPYADTNWEYFTEVDGPHLSDDVYIDTETAELVECLSKKYLIS
jgi:serine/threonine protein kinase